MKDKSFLILLICFFGWTSGLSATLVSKLSGWDELLSASSSISDDFSVGVQTSFSGISKAQSSNLELVQDNSYLSQALVLENNPIDNGYDPSAMRIDFSESINLDDFWIGGLAVSEAGRDWAQITAYNSAGERINPSRVGGYQSYYNQICPQFSAPEPEDNCSISHSDDSQYFRLIQQNDSVLLRANVKREDLSGGRVFFSYKNISSLEIRYFLTDALDDSSRSNGKSEILLSPMLLSRINPFEPSVAPIDDQFVITRHGALDKVDLLANDFFDDILEKKVYAVNGNPGLVGIPFNLNSGSQVRISPDGLLEYLPSPEFKSLSPEDSRREIFTYSLISSEGEIYEAEVSVEISG